MSGAKIDEKRLAEIEARASEAHIGACAETITNSFRMRAIAADLTDLIAALRAERVEAARIFGQHGELQTMLGAALARGDGLADELRAAMAEIDRLSGENQKLKAEVARHEDADVARAVRAMGPPWQCSACAHVYRGRLYSKCQACGREGYYSGRLGSEALATYDEEQAKRIRARGGKS